MKHERDKDIRDAQTLRILERDHYRCQYPGCYESASEKAHCIARTQSNTISVQLLWNQEYNEARNYDWIYRHVINGDANLKASCRRHNDYQNIGFKPASVREKIHEIHEQLQQEGVVK